jgi:hypothetical protein
LCAGTARRGDQIVESLKCQLRLSSESSSKTDQTVFAVNLSMKTSINSSIKKTGIRFQATLRSLCEYRPFFRSFGY